jgi:hypothetical protein
MTDLIFAAIFTFEITVGFGHIAFYNHISPTSKHKEVKKGQRKVTLLHLRSNFQKKENMCIDHCQ